MEDNRSLLDRLNEKEEAQGLDKAEANEEVKKDTSSPKPKSSKKKKGINTDNAEKVIWGACGFLGAIFLIMLIVFI